MYEMKGGTEQKELTFNHRLEMGSMPSFMLLYFDFMMLLELFWFFYQGNLISKTGQIMASCKRNL